MRGQPDKKNKRDPLWSQFWSCNQRWRLIHDFVYVLCEFMDVHMPVHVSVQMYMCMSNSRMTPVLHLCRCFRHFCTAMKMKMLVIHGLHIPFLPTLTITRISHLSARHALEHNQSVVIGLQSTGEMALNNMLERRGDAMTSSLYSAMHEQITSFIMKYFPTFQSGDSGSPSQPEDYDLPPSPSPEALRERQSCLDLVDDLHLPPNTIDYIIDVFGGKDKVAEMTGRLGE